MGQAAGDAGGLLLSRKADLVTEKGAGRKDAQVPGEVAVAGDTPRPGGGGSSARLSPA